MKSSAIFLRAWSYSTNICPSRGKLGSLLPPGEGGRGREGEGGREGGRVRGGRGSEGSREKERDRKREREKERERESTDPGY